MKYYTLTLTEDEVKEIQLMVECTLDKITGLTADQFMEQIPRMKMILAGTELAKDMGMTDLYEDGIRVIEIMKRKVAKRLAACESLRNKLKSLDYV